jgi:hypothetical protein
MAVREESFQLSEPAGNFLNTHSGPEGDLLCVGIVTNGAIEVGSVDKDAIIN